MKGPHPHFTLMTACCLGLLLAGCASDPATSATARSALPAASPASPEEQMRQVLRGYKVGVTTHKKFNDDATAGSWKVGLGGMGMEVLSGNYSVTVTAGLENREVCELVFAGKAPPTSGKAPDLDRMVLKHINFKP